MVVIGTGWIRHRVHSRGGLGVADRTRVLVEGVPCRNLVRVDDLRLPTASPPVRSASADG